MAEVIGRWDDVFGPSTSEVQTVGLALRGLIRALHPAVVEVARPGDRAVSFGHGPRKMKDSYAYLMPQRSWVNLGFYQGASLSDPFGLLEGTGKALRHVKVRDADLPVGLRELLVAARADRI
ncbi:MAG: DUF1801 domain-containing protein [bacterium]